MSTFTFVVSRYGEHILGGAEKHARDIAEALAARGHHVRVVTSCATKYATWKNDLPAGVSSLNGVEVERHRVALRRLVGLDDVAKAIACAAPKRRMLAEAWYVAAGPVAPSIVDRAVEETKTRDLVVYFSFLSRLTAHALDRAPRAALVPLVHDEPPIHLSRAAETLRRPAVILANTEEEWARIRSVAGRGVAPGLVVATGQSPPPTIDPSFEVPDGVRGEPYVLLLGRMAKAKSVIATWREVQRSNGTFEWRGAKVPVGRLKLLCVGEKHAAFDGIRGVVATGFVDDATRWQLVHRAVALINPSVYESLSLVLLEAWACGVPVVVSSRCDVTVGQCKRSGGGLAVEFADPASAAAAIVEGLKDEAIRAEMGARGRAYVGARYGWPRIVGIYERVAHAMAKGGAVDVEGLR